ncbi:ACP S-malonyltransferase [Nocardiopsis prasina]|uniref:ACP S-malonyltransferase n=1 Tax=Nocardiopsis prasina TaxID=2015 RepID=UPI00037749F3|nr:ACP S-malonyltransferase [Nocardiopsis prasina]
MRAVLFGGTVPPLHAKVGEFLETDSYARERLAQAEEVLGDRVLPRFSQATESYSPEARQAYLVTCVALADRARDEDGEAGVCAAASIGHLPALHYSGALSFADMVLLGEAVTACENEWNATDHGLVSHFMYRVGRDRLAQLCAEVEAEGGRAEVAGHFSDTIHLLNVSAGSLPQLERGVRAGGGVPVLTFPQAEHSGVNAPLRDRIGEAVSGFRFRDARVGFVRGADGALVDSAEDLRSLLRDDCVTPVDFPLVVDRLRALGVDRVHVIGPGNLFERLTKEHFDVTVLVPDARARGLEVPDSGPARVGGRVPSNT